MATRKNNQRALLNKVREAIHHAEPLFTKKIINAIIRDVPMSDILTKYEIENVRVCSECGKLMDEGFCIESGADYYCSKKCLLSNMTMDEYNKMYDDGKGDSYYTSWETC